MRASIKVESRAYFKAFGCRLHELRKQHGLTQDELAQALGVSQQTVFAYELGERRVTVLVLAKLAKVFDVPAEELMGMAMPRQRRQRRSVKILRHAERIQRLSKTQQRFVIKIIDVFLEQRAPVAGN
jgi:transcriptional regulator with XRE-family HTH domain